MLIGEGRDVYEWYGMHGDKLPAPDDIAYYPDGSFLPMMFHFAVDTCKPSDIANEHGFEIRMRSMVDVLPDDDPLVVAYTDGDGAVVRRWLPPSIGDGFKLVGKSDTEDGPVAIYVRKRCQE